MAVYGLDGSHEHSQNSMTLADMRATMEVTDMHREVIIFRSTGPWAKRWIERGYPTKNFHVKGKSSNWGPQAGLVPFNGKYSKVGANPKKAEQGTQKNQKGQASGFAGVATLVMSMELINEQKNRQAGKSRRTALHTIFNIAGSENKILVASRPGDNKDFAFKAVKQPDGTNYEIHAYPDGKANPYLLASNNTVTVGPLEVMTSGEVGANKPMTGDYDLLAICPSWADYGSKLPTDVYKPGIVLRNGKHQPGVSYRAGVGMDNVLDPSLHTMSDRHSDRARRIRVLGNAQTQGPFSANSLQQFQSESKSELRCHGILQKQGEEHPDMGNLTPRILRCITNLNAKMGAGARTDKAALRRVHHNAESHRHAMFSAITQRDMENAFDEDGFADGFPFTVFQPTVLSQHAATRDYGRVCTLETYSEFQTYAAALKQAGYFVPKNWTWGLP